MGEERNIPRYYCNVVGIDAGAFDFIFKFGLKKKRNNPVSDEDFDIEIIMSPQHAKSLLEVLNQVVANYEKEFGNLNINGISRGNVEQN
jgi:hypothetical protein